MGVGGNKVKLLYRKFLDWYWEESYYRNFSLYPIIKNEYKVILTKCSDEATSPYGANVTFVVDLKEYEIDGVCLKIGISHDLQRVFIYRWGSKKETDQKSKEP